MRLEDQVVSLELAKRLKELGVKQESYFGWSEYEEFDTPSRKQIRGNWVLVHRFGSMSIDSCAAFTVAELGEMLPQLLPMEKHKHHWGRLTLWRVQDNWQLAYNLESKQCHEIDALDKSMANTFAKMLIDLIEKGIVKP